MTDEALSDATRQPRRPTVYQVLGPGLLTGAADDDPSGIATYSQVGAQFGYGLAWTLVFSYPLMAAIQEISARISGRAPASSFVYSTSWPACQKNRYGLIVVPNTATIAIK